MFNYQNPYLSQLMQPLPQPLAPLSQVTQVQSQQNAPDVSGRAGAEAYPMGPNSTALLLDNTAPILWVVKTDSGGYKTLSAFDIAPHDEKKQEDVIKSLEDRIKKIEERLNNGKSNSQDAAKQQRRAE